MARRVDIERAVVFALLCPDTADRATELAAGLRARDFTDPCCRLSFEAIRGVKRSETGGADCARRYGHAWRACMLLRKVEVTTDIAAELGITIPAYQKVPVTERDIEEFPAFVHEGVKPGDMVYEDAGEMDTSETVRLNPVDHLFQTFPEISMEQIENAFKQLKRFAQRA